MGCLRRKRKAWGLGILGGREKATELGEAQCHVSLRERNMAGEEEEISSIRENAARKRNNAARYESLRHIRRNQNRQTSKTWACNGVINMKTGDNGRGKIRNGKSRSIECQAWRRENVSKAGMTAWRSSRKKATASKRGGLKGVPSKNTEE